MRLIDLLSLIADNLGRRKGRVALTAIGVVIGTAAVVLLVSLAIGLQQNATSQLWGIDDLTRIDVSPGYSEGPVISGRGGLVATSELGGGMQVKNLTPAAIDEIASLPGVEHVIPRDYLWGGGTMRYGRLENYPSIMGVGTNDLSVFGYQLREGSLQLERGTAVIGHWIAQNWYDPKARPGDGQPEQPDLVGKTVTVTLMKWAEDGTMIEKKVQVRVVGILAEQRSEADGWMFMRLDDVTAYNEWFQGKRINRNKDGYPMLVVKASDPDKVIEVAEQINNMGFMASTPQSVVEGINSFFTVLQITFGGVGAIALLVAAIGIANTMTMAILERTREIGLMKAIGATNRDVLTIFLGESAGIGFIGGLGGIAIGWVGGELLNILARTYLSSQPSYGMGGQLTASTPTWLLLFALVFATLVGLISGLYPSVRAATLVPVTALKYE